MVYYIYFTRTGPDTLYVTCLASICNIILVKNYYFGAMEGQPIESVEQYISIMFNNATATPGYLGTVFNSREEDLDEDAVWDSFHRTAHDEIYKRSKGDLVLFSNYDHVLKLQEAILVRWPEDYYLNKLVNAGILHKFETSDKEVFTYAVKEAYIPLLNSILTEVDTMSGS